MYNENIELIQFEYKHDPFLQMPTEQEAKEGYSKAFDEMYNIAFKTKLLSGGLYTNLSLGFLQMGQ